MLQQAVLGRHPVNGEIRREASRSERPFEVGERAELWHVGAESLVPERGFEADRHSDASAIVSQADQGTIPVAAEGLIGVVETAELELERSLFECLLDTELVEAE